MIEWTPLMVETRFVEAASVLKQLPEVRVQGYFSTWPVVVYEFSDLVGQAQIPWRPRPSPAAIDRMEETLDWTKFMEKEHAKIVWRRAAGKPWKAICWEIGVSRQMAHQYWLYALCVVAWRLNGRSLPKRRSMLGLVQRVRGSADENKLRP